MIPCALNILCFNNCSVLYESVNIIAWRDLYSQSQVSANKIAVCSALQMETLSILFEMFVLKDGM